jgi:imidazole glycerol-phosphate synthase subunit HisF
MYIACPINMFKIFKEKEVDEIFFLDIDATTLKKNPPYSLIQNIDSECFMPVAFGGGIQSVEQIEKILKLGTEKIIINSKAFLPKNLINESVRQFGSSTIAV